jgi:putative Holliday junction resolvase
LILLGLDVGEKRIGVAVSDPLGATAQPLETMERDEHVAERIGRMIRETGATRLVVGLPLLMDGSEGAQARRVREFAKTLGGKVGAPVEFVDERLTTREAEGVLSEGGVKSQLRKEASDRIAAALILRSYMDRMPEE